MGGAGVGRHAGEEGNKKQGKMEPRPGVGWGHGALQAELRRGGGGFLGYRGRGKGSSVGRGELKALYRPNLSLA